jgi:hypothetical protein
MASGTTIAFITVALSLIVSSLLISGAISSKMNENTSFINIDTGTQISSTLNFSDCSKNYTSYFTSGYQDWECIEGIGITSPTFFSEFYFQHPLTIDGKYIQKYYINATENNSFTIIPRKAGNDFPTVSIRFEQNRIRIPNNLPLSDPLSDIEVSYPNLLPDNNLNITTDFNNENNILTLSVNGNIVLNNYQTLDQYGLGFNDHHGGIDTSQGIFGGNHTGIIIKRINASVQSGENPTSTDLLIDTPSIIFKILAWNIDEIYLPLWLNFLLIKSQIFALIVLGLALIRGV